MEFSWSVNVHGKTRLVANGRIVRHDADRIRVSGTFDHIDNNVVGRNGRGEPDIDPRRAHLLQQPAFGFGSVEDEGHVVPVAFGPSLDDLDHGLPADGGDGGVRTHGVEQVVAVDDHVSGHGRQYAPRTGKGPIIVDARILWRVATPLAINPTSGRLRASQGP